MISGDIMRYEVMKFENIRNLRVDRGYTQKQIGEYLGISQNTYSQYESGKRQLPVDIVIALAKYYGVTTDYLLGVSDIPNPYIMKQNQKNSRR